MVCYGNKWIDGIWGLNGFRVQGSGFRVQGSGVGFAASMNSLPLEGKA